MKTEDLGSIGEAFKSLAMILGLFYFFCLMMSDAYEAIRGKPRRIWIPGKSLVISALTIQILSYLEIYLAQGDADHVEESVFVGESGRVVTCVLLGYFLPGMARAGGATDWCALSALILSLITSESYYLLYAFNEDILTSKFYLYRLVTNVVLLVSSILMVLFTICAILAGKTIRSMLAQRISVIQYDKGNKLEEGSWKKFEDEIVESWVLARVCNPQYVIARSVLISAVGVLVTICIILLVILQFCLYSIDGSFLFYDFGFSFTAWLVSWAFILLGEAIIFCRWFTAAIYYPRFFVRKERQTHPRTCAEDFWTRSVSDLIEMYNLGIWSRQEQIRHGRLKGLVLRLATTLKIHKLFSLLKPLQKFLIRFCKCCFFISELVFRFKFVWYYLRGSDKVLVQPQGEAEKYREILEKVCMPGENWKNLWIANEKTMKQAKDHFSKNKEKGTKCDKLFEFIGPHQGSSGDGRFVNQLESFPLVAKHFPALDENCMRMTALSLLIVIMHLLPLHKDVDKMEKAIEAYRQSLDVMSFIDNSDPQSPTTINMFEVLDIEADRVGVAVCKEFQSLLVDLKKGKQDCLTESPNASGIINKLLEEAAKKLNEQEFPITNERRQTDGGEEQTVREEYCDSRDWSAIVASYSKYRVCKLILSRHLDDEHDLIDYLFRSLSDVIAHCLSKLPYVMVKTCRNWAVEFEEQKIWDAMYTAGKFVGVMDTKSKETKNKETQKDVAMEGSTSYTIPSTTFPEASSSKGTPSVVEMQPRMTSSLSSSDRGKEIERTTEEPPKDQES